MPAMSGGNTTLWRSFPQKLEYRVYIDVPTSIFKRRVNQASFDYPMQSVDYDNPDGNPGVYTDVTAGLTLRVYHGTTGVLKGITRCRFASTLSITFAPVGPGLINFEDNDILDVVDERRLWVEVPRIHTDGTILKDWVEGFVAAEAQPPVANAGPDVAGDVDSGTGLLTVTFDGTGSFPIADSATITTYLWDVGDGTITVGTSASSAITATFPAGRRYISLTVTDSNGNSHTAYALVAAIDGSTLSSWKVSNLRLGGRIESGWEASFAVNDLDTSDIPFGTKVIVYSKEKYGATSGGLNGYTGRETIKFVGWSVRRTVKIKPLTGTDFILNCQNTLAFMAFSQVTTRASSPANWFEVVNLSWWRHMHYLIHWHSNWLDICDFERPSYYASYPAMRIDAETGTLDSQIAFLCKSVRAQFTCDYQGRCYFRLNPVFLNTVELSNWTSIVAITKADWTADGIELEYDEQERIGVVWGSGVVASASTVEAVEAAAPGALPSGIGAEQGSLNNQLLDNKADLLQRVQRQYEHNNRKLKTIKATMKSHGMVADPAWQEAIPITISAADNGAGIAMTTEKTILAAVQVEFNARDGFATESWTLESISQDRTAIGLIINHPGDTPDPAYDYVPDDGTWEDQTPYAWDDVMPVEYVPEVVEPDRTETTEAVFWSSTGASANVWHTADYTQGMSTVWTARGGSLGSVDVMQCLPALNSRQAVYGLYNNQLRYTADIANTTMSQLTTIANTATLMRMKANGSLVIFGQTSGTSWVRHWTGSLGSQINIGTHVGEMCGDVDDFGLNLIVAAAGWQLYFYDGSSFTQMSGLTGITGSAGAEITDVHIPYKTTSGALNNNLSAMVLRYSIYQSATYEAIYNFNTNSVVGSPENITYSDGTPYGVFGAPDSASSGISYGNNFEAYGGNANRIIAGMRKPSGTYRFVTSTDGGSNWTHISLFSVSSFVHFVRPGHGGNGQRAWVVSNNEGIRRTTDLFTTTTEIAMPGAVGNPQLPRGIFQL